MSGDRPRAPFFSAYYPGTWDPECGLQDRDLRIQTGTQIALIVGGGKGLAPLDVR